MREFGQENFHNDEEESFIFIENPESGGIAGIGSDRKDVKESRDKAKKLGMTSLALFLIYQGLPGESASIYAQSRPREATAQSQETRRKLATGEIRERTTGVKSLEQLYKEIATDDLERDFYWTNLEATNNYVELFDYATDNKVELNRDLVPIGPGVKEVHIVHTHVKRPLPPSMEDIMAAIYDKEFFSEHKIAVASQAIEASGRWTLSVNRNKQTDKLKDYEIRERDLHLTLLLPNTSALVRENPQLLNDPKYAGELQNLNEIEQQIQTQLREEFPDVSKDVAQIRQIQQSITVARETGKDKQQIETLIQLYKGLARKYGLELVFEPR